MLYLPNVRQIDGNTTFKNEFRNWTKRMARQALPRLSKTRTPSRKTSQTWISRLPRMGRQVEVPGAETETAEFNEPETALQTLKRSA